MWMLKFEKKKKKIGERAKKPQLEIRMEGQKTGERVWSPHKQKPQTLQSDLSRKNRFGSQEQTISTLQVKRKPQKYRKNPETFHSFLKIFLKKKKFPKNTWIISSFITSIILSFFSFLYIYKKNPN